MAVDHNNPQSRDEEILIATIDGTEYNKLPQSRMEELLLELKEVIEEGGSGGGGIRPIGVTTTPLYDGATTNPIQINGESYTAETGDMVTYQSTEFLFNVNEVWQELGDVSIVLAIINNIFADIAPAFDATGTYAVDDYVIYNDQLYRCITAHTGAWDENDFAATTISDEIADVSDAVNEIKDGTVIDSFADVETALADKVNKVDGKGLSTNDYDDTEKASVAAATSAISAMKDGTDIDSFGDVEVALLDKADISDLGTAAAKNSTNAVTSGSTDLVESGAVKDAIDSAVSRTYHHAGTKTVAQLTHDLLIAANEGNVYEMTDSGTTTSDFMEGIGRPIKEGDNVGIARVSDGVYMFDLLSGFVDTTNFVQKSQTAGLLKNDGTVNTTIENAVDANATAISGIKDGQRIDSFGDVEDWTSASTKSVTGNPITIADAAEVKAKALSMSIEPVQDLHGYDKPWVGGAGVNQYAGSPDCDDYTNIELWTKETATYNGNPVYSKSSAWGGLYKEISLPVGVHTFSFMCKGDEIITNGSKVYLATNSTTAVVNTNEFTFTRTAEWQKFSFTFEVTQAGTVAARVESTGPAKIYISEYQLEAGSTATDYAPYENICPITGHTEASVQTEGVNRFDPNLIINNGWYNDNGELTESTTTGHSELLRVEPNTQYTLMLYITSTIAHGKNGFYYWDAHKNFIGRNMYDMEFEASTFTTITPSNCAYISFQLPIGEGATIWGFDKTKSVFVEGTDTTFVSYQKHTATIALGDTIYGGEVDFNTGVMTVDRKKVSIASIVEGAYSDNDWLHVRFVYTAGQAYIDGNDQQKQAIIIAKQKNNYSGNWEFANVDGTLHWYSNANLAINAFYPKTTFPTFSDFETWYANNPAEFILPLATPFTVQLTPQQMQLLKGTNTLTANGTTISLTYQQDNLVGEVMEQVEPQIDDLQEQIDEIPRLVDYSTTEQKTGQKWIDGKDIYQRSFDITFTAATANWTLFDNSVSYDKLINVISVLINENGEVYPILQDKDSSPRFHSYNNAIEYYTQLSSTLNYVITLQYTKSTT